MLNALYSCLALSFCILQVKSQSPEYTWEDYNGTIPEKAFLASDDPNRPVYVGMALVGKNNCTGTLFPGATEIMVESNGKVHPVKEGLKILTVEHPSKFKWIPTSDKTFWAHKKAGQAVKTGFNSKKKGSSFVGRTITDDDGTLVIGDIIALKIYFVHNNTKKQKAKNYEVLVRVKEEEPIPTEPTPVSDEPTPVSDELTPDQTEATPVPDEPTPAPEEPTPAPEEPTPAPEETTPAPEEPTPAPEETSASESSSESTSESAESTPEASSTANANVDLIDQSVKVATGLKDTAHSVSKALTAPFDVRFSPKGQPNFEASIGFP